MQLDQIKRKTKRIKHRQVARGGKRGKTAGSGTKGQKARSGHRIRPEIRDLIKKLPKMRGRGVNINTAVSEKPQVINLFNIEENFKEGEVVNIKTLLEKNLIRKFGKKGPLVKILGKGELNKKVIIEKIKVSDSVKKIIEKNGGEVR